MGRFDVCVCVHFVINISMSKIRYALLNDMLRGRLVGQKEVSG